MHRSPRFEPYAILVADMVGYSQLLAEAPAGTHLAFTAHLRDIFAPVVGDCRGRVVKTTGDGIVAIFEDADQAERCGHEIQRQLELQANREPSATHIRYRIAVHYGTIVIEQHDVFGLDVNVAIHMQRLAPPGGVCLSSAAFVRLPEPGKQRYRYLGRKFLKNLPDPIAIYVHDPAPAALRPSPSDNRLPPLRRRYLSPPPRLGVVAFQTVAETSSQGALAGIAHDCLTCGLSRFGDAFAVAPIGATMMQVASEKANARDVLSSGMACEYLVHGSCVAGTSSLTLTVHLESLVRRELIWSGKLRVDLEHQFDLIDELVSSELVAPIVLYLERAEADSWSAGPRSEDEILFREAKRLMERGNLASFDQARHRLSAIIDRCGEVGDVYIALARAEHSYGLLLAGDQFVESLESARAYAKKAVEVDDLNPRAHAELALQEMFLKRQGSAAEIYQRALRLNPYDPMLQADWADCLVLTGKASEALPILEKALAGWPRDRAWVEWNLCDAYWALDRPDKVIDILRRQPDQPHVYRHLAASNAKLGRMTEAKRNADKVRQHQPRFSTNAWSQVVPYTNTDRSAEFVDYLKRAGL